MDNIDCPFRPIAVARRVDTARVLALARRFRRGRRRKRLTQAILNAPKGEFYHEMVAFLESKHGHE
jgi:hypothetical protein